MKKIIVALALLAQAQTANVVVLSQKDADRISAAWITLKAAEAEWETAKRAIGEKYLLTPQHGQEWVWGFEFSSDFKAVVPKAAPVEKVK